MIDQHYPEKDWLWIYTDGSQADEANTARARVHCKIFSQCATVGINKSNFDGDIETISLDLQQLLYRLQTFEKMVILVDSKAAIQALSSKSAKIKEDNWHKTGPQTSPDFQENSHIPVGSLPCWNRRQWDSKQTSQMGTTLHAKESPLQADSLKKNLLHCKVATKYKQEANELVATKIWRDVHKI